MVALSPIAPGISLDALYARLDAVRVEAQNVSGKQDAFDLATLLQTVSGLATAASVSALRADLTLFQADVEQQLAFVSRAIAAKVERSDFDKLQSRVTTSVAALNLSLASKASTSAIADLIAAVRDAASRADLEALRNRPPGSREKPGDGVNAHTFVSEVSRLAGEAAALPPLSPSLLAVNASGSVLRVPGNGILASREAVSVETGRIRELRTVVSRFVNSPDPNNDSVRIGVAWLDRFKQVISTGVAFDIADLLVASGRLTRTAYVSASAGPGITLVAPAGAAYFRPFVQMFGAGALTDVEIFVATDATGLTIPPPASTDLVADVAALKSQNPGDRLAALETAVNAPNSVTFATRNDAAGGLIPSTATTVQTRGATSPGDGDHALYRRVASLAASEEGFVNSRDNSSWLRVTGSVLNNIVTWGASPFKTAAQNTAAIQACFNWCRDNNQPAHIPAGIFKATVGLLLYTACTSVGTLQFENAPGSTPAVSVVPLPADVTPIPASFFNGLTSLQRGVSESPEWSQFYGKFVFWSTRDERMIRHPDGRNYALTDSIVVHDPDGKFLPAISWTKTVPWTDGATATSGILAAFAETIRPVIDVQLKVEFTGGTAGEAEAGVQIRRSNVKIYSSSVVSNSPFPVKQGFSVSRTYNTVIEDSFVLGLKETTTNYGVQSGTTIGLVIRNFHELFCRRGYDGNGNSRETAIIGGSYPDGVGGHICYGVYVIGGAYISSDSPNSCPLFMSGGDLVVDKTCTIRLQNEHATIFGARNDGPEFSGRLIIEANIDLDCSNRTGGLIRIIQLGVNVAEGYDNGREVSYPTEIRLGGRIKQRNPNWNGVIELLRVFNGSIYKSAPVTDANGVTTTKAIRFEGRATINPVLDFEAGYLGDGGIPRARVIISKNPDEWTAGAGLDLYVENMPAVAVNLACSAARTDPNQRINLFVRGVETLFHTVAPGSFKVVDVSSCRNVMNRVASAASRNLAGRTTFVGDEVEVRDGIQRYEATWAPGTIANGGVAVFDFTVPVASTLDRVTATHGALQGNGFKIEAYFRNATTYRVQITNQSGASATVASGQAILQRLAA